MQQTSSSEAESSLSVVAFRAKLVQADTCECYGYAVWASVWPSENGMGPTLLVMHGH
jgi:hypothetical protein